VLEGSDKLARDAFVHSVKVFTSLFLFYAFIINYNKTATAMARTAQKSHGVEVRVRCFMFLDLAVQRDMRYCPRPSSGLEMWISMPLSRDIRPEGRE